MISKDRLISVFARGVALARIGSSRHSFGNIFFCTSQTMLTPEGSWIVTLGSSRSAETNVKSSDNMEVDLFYSHSIVAGGLLVKS